ncbi:MAG: hypothetical protein K8I27_07930 [Planctomycetes bacterium]|nr:hypothetical protein [Planctomycetota bacterium]
MLMRFTSPDPIASPSWNLAAYAGNSPASLYDPDGLSSEAGETARSGMSWFEVRKLTMPGPSWAPPIVNDIGNIPDNVKYNVNRYNDEGWDNYLADVGTTGAGYTAGVADSITPYAGNWVTERWADAGVDVSGANYIGGRIVGNLSASIAQMALTGGACGWARGLSRALTMVDLGHGGYAIATGDYKTAVLTLTGHGIGFIGGRMATGHVICFVEGTEIAVQDEDGGICAKNIEEIEVGDLVWSRDEESGEEGFKPVVTLFVNTTDTLTHLSYTTGSLGNETTITGTPGHPFWSVDQGDWVGMHELRPGETLQLAGGQTATATNVRTEHLAIPVTVYNFEVADWHTYHVGTAETGWVWVHNRCNGNNARSTKAQHGYEIVDQNTGKVVKTGVSGGRRTSTGGSGRANRQAAKWSKEARDAGDFGPADRYYARVVKDVPAGPWARHKALKWEKANAARLRRRGHLKDETA